MHEKQRNDPFLYPIIEYLLYSNSTLLWHLPQYLLRYVLSGRYRIINNLLYFRHHSNIDPEWQPHPPQNNISLHDFISKHHYKLVIPSILRSQLLKITHSNLHRGQYVMHYDLIQHFWWPGIRRDINNKM